MAQQNEVKLNPNSLQSLKRERIEAIKHQLQLMKSNLLPDIYRIQIRDSVLGGFIIEVSKDVRRKHLLLSG